MHQRVHILGVRVSAVNLAMAASIIESWVKDQRRTYVCVSPVSTLVDCRRDRAYRAIVNAADMVTPDGMPVVWLANAKGHAGVQRTYGPDLMRKLCGCPHLRHYFFGATPEVLAKLEVTLKKEYPHIMIAGMHAPAFRAQAQVEDAKVIATINAAKPDILWVALGSPKQDVWMALNRGQLAVPVMAGVGAAFDFLAGSKAQAPRWIQHSGFEWLFRLLCEPRRLWRRYLIGNGLFIYYLITDSFFRKDHEE